MWCSCDRHCRAGSPHYWEKVSVDASLRIPSGTRGRETGGQDGTFTRSAVCESGNLPSLLHVTFRPVTTRDLIALLDAAGVRRAVVLRHAPPRRKRSAPMTLDW